MELVIEFISNLLYMSYYILTGHLLFDFEIKNKKIWDKVTVLVFMTLVITLTWFYFNLFQKFVIHVVGVFVVMVMCFNERKRYLILFYAGMVPTLAMLSLMFEIVVSESFIYMEILLDDNIREIIAMILLFLYIFFLGRYFKKKHS